MSLFIIIVKERKLLRDILSLSQINYTKIEMQSLNKLCIKK